MSVLTGDNKLGALCAALLMSLMSTWACAGGVGLGATRVVYPSNVGEVALSISNTDQDHAYLIQSWVDTSQGDSAKDFLVTPPLFKIKKNSENTLRLMYAGPPLAQDRETLFFVNVKAIPSKNKDTPPGQGTLQLAVVSRIKLFYRPAALMDGVHDAASKVSVAHSDDQLMLKNPTPYIINLAQLSVGSHTLSNMVLMPFSEAQQPIPKGVQGTLSYSFVNDYGGLVKLK